MQYKVLFLKHLGFGDGAFYFAVFEIKGIIPPNLQGKKGLSQFWSQNGRKTVAGGINLALKCCKRILSSKYVFLFLATF